MMPAFLPASLAQADRPLLCVVIDTEEEFDWSGPFSRHHDRTDSILHIGKGQEIFRRHGVKPAYLIDYPIADDPRASEVFGPWSAAGECLVGAQLHPWVSPPYEEVVCPYNSYPCNLEPDLERRKLQALTARIADQLGIAPRVYKAGRYGLDITREAMLLELGYEVDTSVMPYRNFSGLGGGPDFFGFPDQPFWTSPERRLLYLPVGQSLVGSLRGLARGRFGRKAFGKISARLRVPGILARFRLLERIMLTPEGVSLDEMRRLVDSQLADGNRVFALSLHSPSFMPGGTPYTRSEAELRGFLDRIDRFLDDFLGRLGGQPITPLALREMLLRQPA